MKMTLWLRKSLLLASLLLLILTTASWIHSHISGISREWRFDQPDKWALRTLSLDSGYGRFALSWQIITQPTEAEFRFAQRLLDLPIICGNALQHPPMIWPIEKGFAALGFAAGREQTNGPKGSYSLARLVIPYWALLLATAAFPLKNALSAYRAKTAPGHCRSCGYDLRATPTRCPECGHSPTPPPLLQPST